MGWFKRQPDVEITVEAGSSDTAVDAMLKLVRFQQLVRRFNLDLISHEGKTMVLRGKPKNVEGFRLHYDFLRQLEQI